MNSSERSFESVLITGLLVLLGLMLGLPAAVALYLLAEPLIATLFMSFTSGAMTPHDVRMAALALQMFAVALPGFVLVKVLAPAFFAHEDTKSPLKYASGAVAANLAGSLLIVASGLYILWRENRLKRLAREAA